jgi:hypothetical protein
MPLIKPGREFPPRGPEATEAVRVVDIPTDDARRCMQALHPSDAKVTVVVDGQNGIRELEGIPDVELVQDGSFESPCEEIL